MAGPSLPSLRLRSSHSGAGTTSTVTATSKDSKDAAAKDSKSGKRHHDTAAAAPTAKDRAARDHSKDRAGGKRSKLAAFFLHPGGDRDRDRDRSSTTRTTHSNGSTTALSPSPPARATSPLPVPHPHPSSSALARVRAESVRTASSLSIPASAPHHHHHHHATADQSALTLSDDDDLDTDRPTSPVLLDDTQSAAATAADSASTTSSLDPAPPVRRDRAMSLRGFLMDDHRAHPSANPAHHAASTPVPRVQLIGSTPAASAISIAASAASSSAAGAARSPSALASLRARWSATTTKAARAVKNATKSSSSKQHKHADPVPLDDDYLVPSYTPMKLVARSPLASSATARAALEALNLLPDSGSPAATSAPISVPASASAMHRRKSLHQRELDSAAGVVVGSAPAHVPVPMPSPIVDATDPATASDPVTVSNMPTSSPTPAPATPRKTSVASKLKLAASSEKLRRRKRTGSATSTAAHPGELSPRPRSATHDVSAPEFQQLANIFGWSLDSGLPNVQSPRTARASSVSAASVKSVASARSVAGSAARGSHDAVPPLPILVGSFTGLHDDHHHVPAVPTTPTLLTAEEAAGHDAHPPPSSIAATVGGGVATPPDSAAAIPPNSGGRRHIDDVEWWHHVEVSYKKRASAASTVASHVPPHRRSTMNGSRTSARASMYSAASGRRSTSDGALVVRSRAGSRAAAAAEREVVDASEPVVNGVEGAVEDVPQVPHLPAHAEEADEEVQTVVAVADPDAQEPMVEPTPAVDADNVPIAAPSGHGSSVGVPLDMAATSPDLSPTADMPTSPLTSTSAADVTEHDDDVDDVQLLTQERRRLDRVAAQRHQSLRRPRSNEHEQQVEVAVPAEDAAVAVEEEEVDVVEPASPPVSPPADLPSPAIDAREPFPDSPITAADATTPVVPSSAVLAAIPLPVMGFRVPELETHVDVFAWAQAVAAAEGDEMQSSATALEMVRRLTSEIDYDFLSDFFIVYRMFMDPLHLAKLLVLRVRASVPFPADSDARRVSRFRTFVVLRHWFQNYYEYDFADNKALRRYMGKALKTMTHMPALMATGMDRRQIKAIKRLWISCSEKYNPVNALGYDAESTGGGALSFATTAASDISPPPSVINVSLPPVPALPAGEINAHHVATHHLEGGAAKRQQMRSSVWSNTTGTATSVGSGESDGLAPPHTLSVRLNMALLNRSSSVASSTASSSDVYSGGDPNVTNPAAHLNPAMAARLHRSLSARTDSAVGTSACPSPVAGVRVSIQSTSGDSAMPLTAVASMYRANGAAVGDAASVMAIMGDYDRVDEEDEDDDEPTTWMHRMAATEAPTPAVAAAALAAHSPPLVATPAAVPKAVVADVDHEPTSLRLADVANGTILRVRSPVPPPPTPSSALTSPMTSPLADRPVSPLPARLAAPSHLSLDRSMTQSSSTSHGGTLAGTGAGSVHQAPSIMGASTLHHAHHHHHHYHHHHKDSFRHKIKNVFKPRTESVRSYETESAADISVSAPPAGGVASPPAHRPSASSTPPMLTSPLPAALRGLDGKKGVTDAMMQAMASEAMHDMAKSYTHAAGPAAHFGRALGFHSGTMPWILRVRSSEVAQHLSIVEQVRVRRVDWTELLEIAVGRHPLARSGSRGMLFGATMARRNTDEDEDEDEDVRHGNVREVIDRFNTTCQWVTSQILSAEDVAVRARAIEKFIKIAAKCAAYSNYSTLMAITLGLQSPYVDRLKRTWAKVHAEKRATLQQLVDLTSPFRNFKDLRAAMEDCATGVPFIGIYLSDLLFNNELPDIIPDRASMASRSAKSGAESDETEDDEMENEALRKRRARAKAVRAARARAERYRRLAHEIAQYHDAQFAAHPRATGSPLIDLEQDLTTLVNWQKYKTMAKVVKQFRAFLEGPTYASTAAWPMRESLFWRLLAVEDEVLPMAELERRSFLYEPSNRRSVGGPLVGGPAPSPAPGTTTSLPRPRPVPAE
ncbi:hypothetical protein AMAG_10007 [Allomyces macrogynus ATCC 38327]|uniref:Ras GEF n=1 Tax=Allomyces macrogynus (strain ATCC 38327) TaxID=578462 RepID=A0A0L0SQM1_ALLM3|nr:hypothetical protein AMAG_10007 [Allomyces macrogynus ATCC 38327]|eukprot:KNE64650.1 hypothetical protein AMAG_10007 [Allomyces macrogynus ATCC 38327]